MTTNTLPDGAADAEMVGEGVEVGELGGGVRAPLVGPGPWPQAVARSAVTKMRSRC
jgi:hypothetical protein